MNKKQSPALPGKPMSRSEFVKWIKDREASPTISLEKFKKKWTAERKRLLRLINSGKSLS